MNSIIKQEIKKHNKDLDIIKSFKVIAKVDSTITVQEAILIIGKIHMEIEGDLLGLEKIKPYKFTKKEDRSYNEKEFGVDLTK